MKRTLPVLYLATDRRGWCQFLRAVPSVGGGRAEAALLTDWQGTVVAADIALLLLKLRQAGQEERRSSDKSRHLSDERTRRCKVCPTLPAEIRSRIVRRGNSPSPSLFLSFSVYVYALHAWAYNDMSDLGRQPRYSMGRFCNALLSGDARVSYSLADSRAQTRHAPHRA